MLRQQPKLTLDSVDTQNNHIKLVSALLPLAQNKISPIDHKLSPADADQLVLLILNFTIKHAITLNNLIDDEETALLLIMENALKQDKINQTALEQVLTGWKNKLKHAVAGHASLANIYAAQTSGIAADLIHTRQVSAQHWCTDLDIRQALQGKLTDPRQINKAGTYILSPVSLTEGQKAIETVLQEAMTAIKTNKVLDKVKLRI